MTTLKEFEDALREHGMEAAIALLEELRRRDSAKRSMSPARRVTGRKMTPELALKILDLHTATDMTQQEIAFKLGVNQGRVNEVIKRGKWLTNDPTSPEAIARDRALRRASRRIATRRPRRAQEPPGGSNALQREGKERQTRRRAMDPRQLVLGDL